MKLNPVIKAGFAYWALIFALGFMLGALRVLVLEGALSSLAATLLELPLMLGASWLVARWLVRRFVIADGNSALVMGAIAFLLLMASELVLTAAMQDNSPQQWLARMSTSAGAIGLGGQILFAMMPWMLVRCGASRR